ncbi:MAG: ABC transporter permease [Bacteroidia bacterium]
MRKSNPYWLGVFIILAVVPLLAGLIYALLYSLGLVGVLGKGFTLQHWTAILGKGEVWVSIGYSLGIGIVSIGLAGLLALALVLRYPTALGKGFPGLSRYLPLCIPPIAAGFFSFQFLGRSGWLSRLCYQLGFIENQQAFPEFIQDKFAIGVILTHVMLALPFFLLLLGSLYSRLGIPAFLEQGKSLGASAKALRRKIAAPLLLRAAFPTFVLYTLFVTGAYEIPLLLGRQSPQMISVLTVRYLRHYDLQLIPQAYIVAIIYAVLMLLTLVLTYRWLVPPSQSART